MLNMSAQIDERKALALFSQRITHAARDDYAGLRVMRWRRPLSRRAPNAKIDNRKKRA